MTFSSYADVPLGDCLTHFPHLNVYSVPTPNWRTRSFI